MSAGNRSFGAQARELGCQLADGPTLSIAPVVDPRSRFAGLGVSGVW